MQTLFDSQQTAIEKLRQFKVGALFMEPGTGKTRTALELIKSVPECDFILWLTPFQTKENLRAELDKCGGLECLIVGIETLSSSDATYLGLIHKLSGPWTKCPFIVVDESLKIKNWDAKRTRRIIELGRLAEYKLVLNGTPLSRNLLDLWAQMEFLSPKILGMGLAEFKNTFCSWTRITKTIGCKHYTREFITGYHNVDHLYTLIGHYVYECDLDLDVGKSYNERYYELDDTTREEYLRLKNEYLDNEKLMAMNNNIFLELTQKMQHLYCATADKFRVMAEILNDQDQFKVIVFTKFIASAQKVKLLFPDVTVLSYGKHSYGLNMQQFNTCIFFDKTWDYAQRIQSEARIYRKGQRDQCIYFDLTGDIGLEKMISKNIDKKQGLLEYFKSKAVREILNEL